MKRGDLISWTAPSGDVFYGLVLEYREGCGSIYSNPPEPILLPYLRALWETGDVWVMNYGLNSVRIVNEKR